MRLTLNLTLFTVLSLTQSVLAVASQKKNSHAGAQYRYNYGMAGCGLGSMLVDTPDRQNDKVFQAVASIVNQFGFQTFAISSGTSNCESTPQTVALMEQQVYVTANLSSLEKEASQGAGEHLFAFADVLGCLNQREEFANLSQNRYGVIFSDNNAEAILSRYVAEIKATPTLAENCQRIY